jgi:transposase-like protein
MEYNLDSLFGVNHPNLKGISNMHIFNACKLFGVNHSNLKGISNERNKSLLKHNGVKDISFGLELNEHVNTFNNTIKEIFKQYSLELNK